MDILRQSRLEQFLREINEQGFALVQLLQRVILKIFKGVGHRQPDKGVEQPCRFFPLSHTKTLITHTKVLVWREASTDSSMLTVQIITQF